MINKLKISKHIMILFILNSILFSNVITIPIDYNTIQEGIESSIEYDTIYVLSGTYYENINYNSKNIAIIGEDQENTIINGEFSGNVVRIDGGVTSGLLSTLTVMNGQSDNGAGIIIDNSTVELKMLTIKNNIVNSHGYGGGIYSSASQLDLNNVVIYNNTGFNGAGLYLDQSYLYANQVTFANNNGIYWGAIAGNSNSYIEIINSILWDNNGGEIDLINMPIDNINITYSNITNNWGGIGNINENPLFCGSYASSDNATKYSLAMNSPCLNSGFNDADMGAMSTGCLPILIPETFYTIAEDRRITIVSSLSSDYIQSLDLYLIDSLNEELLTSLESNGGSYVHENLENGIEYYYQIRPIDINGDTLGTIPQYISAIPDEVSFNVDLVNYWNYRAGYNDIWGYTDSQGREFALIGSYEGTSIIDISSNELSPQEVAYIPGLPSIWRDIKVYNDYMYISTEASQGIQVVNIEDPYNSIVYEEWDGIIGAHNIMSESSRYLYVIGANEGEEMDDLIILDLLDPSNPQKIGGWSEIYLHDVCIYQNILYGCAIQSDSMYAFDISDKSNPEVIHIWEGVPNAHACWVSDDGRTVFTASETLGGHIMSWDVSNLNSGNINLLDAWMPIGGENWSAHNIFYKNEFLYVSYYTYGLQILNVADPSNMHSIGYFDTYPFNEDVSIYSGVWGVFPFYETDKVVISDRSTGLYTVNFNYYNEVIKEESLFIERFYIGSPYPNPFNPYINLYISIYEPTNIKIDIYDINGKYLKNLTKQRFGLGKHLITWDASKYNSGTYFLRYDDYDSYQTKKITLIK